MNDDEMKYLEKAINNDNNESLVNLTFDKIEEKKREIFDELGLSKKKMKEFLKKLEDYRYVEEINELQYGNYLLWINLINSKTVEIIDNPENLVLTKMGGVLCEIKIEDNINLVIKNPMNRFFQISMDKILLFQKLSDQEKVILYALDCLDK